MKIRPELSSCSIILLGRFDPLVFQPYWLIAKGIESEANAPAKGKFIIVPQLAHYLFDTREYRVEPESFRVSTTEAPWVKILEASTSIFGQHFKNIEISRFGVNISVHFKLADVASRTKLFRKLAPIKPWGEYGQAMEIEDPKIAGGLVSLGMVKKSIFDGYSLDTVVKTETSVMAPETGVYMEVSCNHVLHNLPAGHGSEQAIQLLGQRFNKSTEEAVRIIDHIMSMASEQ